MNPEIKAKWLEALRSGRYKQGRKKLRPTPDTYCCLGVLCDILGDDWNHPHLDYEYDGETFELGEGVLTRAEIADADFVNTTLANNNDAGWSFEHLARLIESEL
jgi:hypothetical protein